MTKILKALLYIPTGSLGHTPGCHPPGPASTVRATERHRSPFQALGVMNVMLLQGSGWFYRNNRPNGEGDWNREVTRDL